MNLPKQLTTSALTTTTENGSQDDLAQTTVSEGSVQQLNGSTATSSITVTTEKVSPDGHGEPQALTGAKTTKKIPSKMLLLSLCSAEIFLTAAVFLIFNSHQNNVFHFQNHQ
uniref:Uncharacterized protein n=1 Tax=Panagrolaimus superbus TaxID=310955 RepID=A0A914ZAT7_9BILA